MNVRYYVIASGVKEEGVEMRLGIVAARSKVEAHQMAMGEFRKTNNFPSSKHVQTHSLFDSDNELEAEVFYFRFHEEIQKHKTKATQGDI